MDDEFQLIINANEFTSLRVLDIRDCRLNDDATFRAIRKLNALEDLRFSASHFPQPLVGWEGVGRFTHWELPSAITAGQVAELFPRPSSRLRSLSGVGPTVLPQHPRVLAECAEALTDICLSVSNMGTEKFQILVAAESMKTLRRLHAFSCSLDDEAVDTLIASGPQSLVELDLCYNDLTSKSVVELANWKGIEHVVFLNLSANRPFNHDAYRALLESPYLDPVKLELGPIDDDKIAMPWWIGLGMV